MLPAVERSQTMLEDLDRPGFFKDYYRNVRKSITNDQLNLFAKLRTDEDRVRFCFGLPAVHDIDIRTYYKGKSEKEALEKKEAGNKAFGRKKNFDALKLYSQAVLKAPVPTGKYWKLIKENADPRKMTLYAICLANRSAALFHLKEFFYCVKDIDEALEHHYPKELRYKLYKRKARILVSLKRHEEARDGYRQALKWLDWAKMEREKRIEQQNEIQKWLRLFETGKVVKNADLPEVLLLPKVPEVANGPNDQFPGLSKKVNICYENNRGRYAVAAEDIAPGDVICSEKSYASVLLFEQYGTHCQNCFLITKAAIPCKTCSGVLFCSTSCRSAAYFHTVECQILDLLHGSGMSINCFLAFRMATQTPVSYFLSLKENLTDEDAEDILKNPSKYDDCPFLKIYNCVRHSEKRTVEDFFHRTIMACFLLKALKKTKYFEEKSSGFGDKLNDTEAFIGGLLLRFSQIVQFNAHEISEFQLTAPNSLEGAKNASIGAGIFPTLAFFNHSCHSAQVRLFSGTGVITRSIRPLAKGAEVPENYGPTFTAKKRSERRVTLADRYWFECSCEACIKDWPTYQEMNDSLLHFKCKKCQGNLPVQIDTTTPFYTCEGCGEETNILAALKNLQNTEQTFKAACKEMQAFELQKAEALLVENLQQLDACLYPPYRDYHLTQEAFMRCCLCEGNRRVVKELEETQKE